MSIQSETEYPSLTPSVVQVGWKTPTEFPECPDAVSDNALEEYASRLEFATHFCQNAYGGSSWVVHRQLTEDGLVVLTHFGEQGPKDWAVVHISIRGDKFYHRSESTFFTLQGALKHFCLLAGEDFHESIDDDC